MSYVKFVQGKLGGGKGKYSVLQMQEYLRARRPVATNMNLNLEKLLPPRNKMSVIRVPDKPRIQDLENLGFAYEGKYNKKRNGLLVLDELGTWFNARTWNDKSRKEIIDFILHIRKYGWDVIFQVQDISLVDKQLREATGQLLTNCINLDHVPIPVISFITRLFFGRSVYFPEFHKANTYLGGAVTGYKLEGHFFKGKDIESSYDTRQVFQMDELIHDDVTHDMRSSYCILSSWHLRGRYIGTVLDRIKKQLKYLIYIIANQINYLIYGRPLAAGSGLPYIKKSILIKTVCNEFPITHIKVKFNEVF